MTEICWRSIIKLSNYPLRPTNTWRLTDAVNYEFPQGISLPPHGCLVVVSFDPQRDLVLKEAFESIYGPGLTLLGPFNGRLSNSGETVTLEKPEEAVIVTGAESNFIPYVCVDQVIYDTNRPEIITANGSGWSIHRNQTSLFGNDPIRWQAEPPTPGQCMILPTQLRIEISRQSGDTIRVLFPISTNQWILQQTDNFLSWNNILTNNNQNVEQVVTNFHGIPYRFFRAVLPKFK